MKSAKTNRNILVKVAAWIILIGIDFKIDMTYVYLKF